MTDVPLTFEQMDKAMEKIATLTAENKILNDAVNLFRQEMAPYRRSPALQRAVNLVATQQDHSWVNQGICCRFHATAEQKMSTMIVCPECGDKRCAKASMCDADCENSAATLQERIDDPQIVDVDIDDLEPIDTRQSHVCYQFDMKGNCFECGKNQGRTFR